MTDLIIAILLYIGAVATPAEVDQQVVTENQDAIEYYKNDADFKDYYDKTFSSDSHGIFDVYEMD